MEKRFGTDGRKAGMLLALLLAVALLPFGCLGEAAAARFR